MYDENQNKCIILHFELIYILSNDTRKRVIYFFLFFVHFMTYIINKDYYETHLLPVRANIILCANNQILQKYFKLEVHMSLYYSPGGVRCEKVK